MSAAKDVLNRARAYADGRLSTLELYEWLSARRNGVQDQLEADLWGVCFEVDERRLTESAAHQWLSERLRHVSNNSPRRPFIVQTRYPHDVVVLDAERPIFDQEQPAAGYSVSIRPHALVALS